MALAALQQNANAGQVAVNLIGRTVANNKGPGIAESASIMNGNSRVFTLRNPPPVHSGGIGLKLDVVA